MCPDAEIPKRIVKNRANSQIFPHKRNHSNAWPPVPPSLQALLATSLPLSIRLPNLSGRRRCGESEPQKQPAAGQDPTPPVLSSSVSDGFRATVAFSIKPQWEVEWTGENDRSKTEVNLETKRRLVWKDLRIVSHLQFAQSPMSKNVLKTCIDLECYSELHHKPLFTH